MTLLIHNDCCSNIQKIHMFYIISIYNIYTNERVSIESIIDASFLYFVTNEKFLGANNNDKLITLYHTTLKNVN